MGYEFLTDTYSFDIVYSTGNNPDDEMYFTIDAYERFRCVSLAKWLKYDDLQDWRNILAGTNFFDQSSRQNAANKFGCMKRELYIFKETKRFPDELYVCLGNRNIRDIILATMSSLDIDKNSSSADVHVSNQAFSQAFKSLNTVCCLTMPQDLAQYGIFKRSSFEERYSLVWKDYE